MRLLSVHAGGGAAPGAGVARRAGSGGHNGGGRNHLHHIRRCRSWARARALEQAMRSDRHCSAWRAESRCGCIFEHPPKRSERWSAWLKRAWRHQGATVHGGRTCRARRDCTVHQVRHKKEWGYNEAVGGVKSRFTTLGLGTWPLTHSSRHQPQGANNAFDMLWHVWLPHLHSHHIMIHIWWPWPTVLHCSTAAASAAMPTPLHMHAARATSRSRRHS